MNNNKNRMRDREKSNAELRKIDPIKNADVGMMNGHKLGLSSNQREKKQQTYH